MEKPNPLYLRRVLENLRDLGWTPGAIIDIGVEAGTVDLYAVWPDAQICLIEPSERAMVHMRQIAEQFPHVQIFNVGASNFNGEIVGRQPDGLINVYFGRGKGFPERTFPMRRCDDIVAEAMLEPPFLYKLDTDSHEREILEGSGDTLDRAEVCVIESNVFHKLRGCLTPFELWSLMDAKGFAFVDVSDGSFGEKGVMRAVDFVFVRESSPLYRSIYDNSGKSAAKLAKRVRQHSQPVGGGVA